MSVGKGSIKRAAKTSAAVSAPTPEEKKTVEAPAVEKKAPTKKPTATKAVAKKPAASKKAVVQKSESVCVNEVYHITEELPIHLL